MSYSPVPNKSIESILVVSSSSWLLLTSICRLLTFWNRTNLNSIFSPRICSGVRSSSCAGVKLSALPKSMLGWLMNSLTSFGAWLGETPENIEMARSLTASLKGMEMSSSASTSDSRYELPFGPAPLPRMEERGCELDSLRQVSSFEVMLERRELSAGVLGAEEEADDEAAARAGGGALVDAPAGGGVPA